MFLARLRVDDMAVVACEPVGCGEGEHGRDNVEVEMPEPMSVRVEGEYFVARADTEQHGVWHLDWLSGPNPGYGLTIGRSDRNWGSRAELENAARDFLRDVDPATCFLE